MNMLKEPQNKATKCPQKPSKRLWRKSGWQKVAVPCISRNGLQTTGNCFSRFGRRVFLFTFSFPKQLKAFCMRKFYISFLGIIGFTVLWAQDIHFSQYYAAPIELNPALTG